MASILITGGTGTLGHALVDHCLRDGYDRVVVYSRSEIPQAAMIAKYGHHKAFRAIVGDVLDRDALVNATRGVDLVVAAAAMKRVETCSYNPTPALNINVQGVKNTIDAAAMNRVPKVVVVSSDKACEPCTFYGHTKAMAEAVAERSNVYTHPQGTRVCAVRYGNVLSSRGSVVPLWREQASRGEPLTITHANMTRFVMTIEQAVGLVMRAATFMQGGEVFIPNIPAATVIDIAHAVVPGAELKVVGLRDATEKLAEVLISQREADRTYLWDGGYVIVPSDPSWLVRSRFTDLSRQVPFEFRMGSDDPDRRIDASAVRALLDSSKVVC